MRYIRNIIRADYLQRTRSYSFLITLAITIYVAYLFVPPPNAPYTTLNAAGFKGVYNSAYVGYLSGMMTAIMLSLYGFFLVTGGIKKDIDTEVGLIIAATPISNFGYLLSKLFSNFLVLLTIAGITFAVSIIMFFVRTNGYPFISSDFILPWLLFVLPALFFTASLAVAAEVFLSKRSILQYIAFVFLFGILMANINARKNESVAVLIDPFGVHTVISSIKAAVNSQYHQDIKAISLGFTFNQKQGFRTFTWNGVSWSGFFLFSRLWWLCFSLAIVYFSSLFFHRFDVKQTSKRKVKITGQEDKGVIISPAGINLALLPSVSINYSILPFIKTELLLLVRRGPKFWWFLNGALWISMLFVPVDIASGYLLPVLLFLQVTRWSDLVTKEKTNRLNYFTYSSYKPLLRMLPAQLLAGVIMAVVLSIPLLVRYLFNFDSYAILNLMNGCIFIVLLSIFLGIVSGGKKLFEIMFFMITYAAIEKLPAADYMGGMQQNHNLVFIFVIFTLNIFLALVSFSVRSYQVRHL